MIHDIYNVELIGSGSLSLMAKAVSGEWIEDEFFNIARFGRNCIVSILELHSVEYFLIGFGFGEQRRARSEEWYENILYPITDSGIPRSN